MKSQKLANTGLKESPIIQKSPGSKMNSASKRQIKQEVKYEEQEDLDVEGSNMGSSYALFHFICA